MEQQDSSTPGTSGASTTSKKHNVTGYSTKMTLKMLLVYLSYHDSYASCMVTVMLMNAWAMVGPDSSGAAGP